MLYTKSQWMITQITLFSTAVESRLLMITVLVTSLCTGDLSTAKGERHCGGH